MTRKMQETNQNFTIYPSLLSCDLSNLQSEVKKVEEAGAEGLHIDVMDGHFVPNLTFGPWILHQLSKITHLPLDVHLMVSNPENQWEAFARAGAYSISVHYEVIQDFSILKEIKKSGILSGLAIKPKTSIKSIFPYLQNIDLALIMTVEPGFSGQKLIESSADKIKTLREELDRQKTSVKIEVDGGVNNQTLPYLSEADILVSGHYIFKSKEYRRAISFLKGVSMKKQKNKGQVAVEYVLLLVIVVALAGVFKLFIDVGSDDQSGAGFIQYWRELIIKIGEDIPHS